MVTDRLNRLVAYFIPAEMARDQNAHKQAKMFLISHLLGPMLGGTVPIALFVLDPTPGLEIAILAAGILAFWLFPFLLRAGIDYHKLVLYSIAVDWFVIYWACYLYGGVTSPTLVWVLIIPILALFYIEGDDRLHWPLLKLSAWASAIFCAAYLLVEPPTNDMPAAALSALGAMSTVATLCYVATMAIYYARIFDAGVNLEIEARRRQALAEELREAIATAHRASAAKAEFLARMSHELRTPLNAIIGYGQVVREDAEDADDQMMVEDIDRILEAARYLVRLINMILDLARIGAGRMAFDIQPHNLREILVSAVAARSPDIAGRGNHASVEVDPQVEHVELDRTRLLQLIDGVLENAARHTSGGAITVSARPFGEGRGIAISIADTGCGMSPEAMATLFETFATSRGAADGRYGGTGLNLAVCGELCRAMGGSIAVSSAVGEGSTFVIRLPLATAPRAEEPAAPREAGTAWAAAG